VTAHLVLFTIGPVQDFIAQARRTRDLWQGSHLLSELSRAAARALVDRGAQLVFPALAAGDPELAPCLAPLRSTDEPPLNIANRLLAELPEGDPAAVMRDVREAVMGCWRDDIAGLVKRVCTRLLADGVDAVWAEQIDSFLEIAAAWAPLPDGSYASARRELDRMIAARKHLRDFAPWRQLRGGVPKSSLDGARETVIECPRHRDASLVQRYRIVGDEQLDAVGLVKRVGGDPRLTDEATSDEHLIQFVPIVNVALASWVAVATREAEPQLNGLKAASRELKLPRVPRAIPCAQGFPFDAMVLLRSRWDAVFEERGLIGEPERWGRDHVVPLLDKMSEPHPYVACLVADGDRMGNAIERLDDAGPHRELSRALASFATDARRVVEQAHLGSLVYAGGDDVLAFLPVPQALACAAALRLAFAAVMARACPDMAEAERPTLSVGIGIGHVMESMGELLELGRAAERQAKGGELGVERRDRNAIAVVVDKRSGGRTAWRAQWTEWGGDPVARLQQDAELLIGKLSTTKVYEIAHTLARLPQPEQAPGAIWGTILAREVRRSLARTHAGDPGIELAELGLGLDDTAGYATVRREVAAWVDRVLVARTFAEAEPRGVHRPGAEAA
jgi:CRISPR-associated protein Cmr2